MTLSEENREIGLCEDCGKLALVGMTNDDEVSVQGNPDCQDCKSQEFTVIRPVD